MIVWVSHYLNRSTYFGSHGTLIDTYQRQLKIFKIQILESNLVYKSKILSAPLRKSRRSQKPMSDRNPLDQTALHLFQLQVESTSSTHNVR